MPSPYLRSYPLELIIQPRLRHTAEVSSSGDITVQAGASSVCVGQSREVAMASRIKRSVPVTVNDVLDGHVALDLECLDRLYLHGYLGQLQVGGQVIQFLNHRGYPVPSPACLQQIGMPSACRVASFAQANHIPVVPLKAADRNIEVMRPYLGRAAETGRSQVAAIGVAQEIQRVFIARKRATDPSGLPAVLLR